MGKMRIGQLKAREVCEGIKNGYGVTHFCVKYDCTKQEFETRLKQLYSKSEKAYKKKLSTLRANDEKLAKKAAKAKVSTTKNVESNIREEVITTDEAAAETVEETVTIETATLEQLKTIEAELSDNLIQLESEHKEKARQHRGCIGTSRELKKELEDMKVQLQGIRRKYENVTTQDNNLIARMNAISAEHYDKTIEIQRVRERIRDLSKIIVFVYADGAVVTENMGVDLNDLGSDEIYRNLFEKDECGELRAREIKTLAKVLAISKHLPENSEIVFDNAEIEEVFRLLSA